MTPESRINIESEWSQWMLIGPDSARLPSAITTGARIEAAMYTTSAMSARPCDDVAVIVRAPASAAPIAALMAECSDSTSTSSPCTRPCATNDAKVWMIGVWGVIGYAGTTSGSICRMASAAAWPPVRIRASTIVRHHLDRIDGAHRGAELAPLAEFEVEAREVLAVETDCRIRAVEPAEQAVDAALELHCRLDAGPPAAGTRLDGLRWSDRTGQRELAPAHQLRHAYPSSTAPRISSGATFFPSSWTAASATSATEGSCSAAASAPTMTRFTNFEPHAGLPARTQMTRAEPRLVGGTSLFISTKPSCARPSATSTSCSSDGSSTTTASGCTTAS